MLSSNPTVELILSIISVYLRLIAKKDYGALSDFAKKHKIPNWMLTRLKNRQAFDSYEPRASTILIILKAMLDNPPMIAEEGLEISQIKGEFPGMEESISIFFQVADILSHRALVDQGLLSMFLMLVATLHKQVLEAVKKPQK